MHVTLVDQTKIITYLNSHFFQLADHGGSDRSCAVIIKVILNCAVSYNNRGYVRIVVHWPYPAL